MDTIEFNTTIAKQRDRRFIEIPVAIRDIVTEKFNNRSIKVTLKEMKK